MNGNNCRKNIIIQPIPLVVTPSFDSNLGVGDLTPLEEIKFELSRAMSAVINMVDKIHSTSKMLEPM